MITEFCKEIRNNGNPEKTVPVLLLPNLFLQSFNLLNGLLILLIYCLELEKHFVIHCTNCTTATDQLIIARGFLLSINSEVLVIIIISPQNRRSHLQTLQLLDLALEIAILQPHQTACLILGKKGILSRFLQRTYSNKFDQIWKRRPARILYWLYVQHIRNSVTHNSNPSIKLKRYLVEQCFPS